MEQFKRTQISKGQGWLIVYFHLLVLLSCQLPPSSKPSVKVYITHSLYQGYFRRIKNVLKDSLVRKRDRWTGGIEWRSSFHQKQEITASDDSEPLELRRRMLGLWLNRGWWWIIPVESRESKESSRLVDEGIQLADIWVILIILFYIASDYIY